MSPFKHSPIARRQWLQHMASLSAVASLSPLAALAAPASAAKAGSTAAPAQRIVSIGGALTEIVYALGAQAQLVGVDSTSIYPTEATQLPIVGYARSLAAEGILALSPSHIIATEEAGPAHVMAKLQQTGLPVSVLDAGNRYEGMMARVQKVGAIVGKVAEADQLRQRLQAQWQQSQARIQANSTAKKPKILFVLSHSPSQIVVAGSGTGAEAMMHYAGARNAVQGFQGFKPLNPEALIAAQPDVILFTDQGIEAIGGTAGILRLPGVAQSKAGQKRRFISLDAMYLLGFGPRMPQAALALHEATRKALAS